MKGFSSFDQNLFLLVMRLNPDSEIDLIRKQIRLASPKLQRFMKHSIGNSVTSHLTERPFMDTLARRDEEYIL